MNNTKLNAYKETLKKSIDDMNMEQFYNFISLVEDTGRRAARELYGIDINEFYICNKCLMQNKHCECDNMGGDPKVCYQMFEKHCKE